MRRFVFLALGLLIMGLVPVLSGSPGWFWLEDSRAAGSSFVLPFDPGKTMYICQGYESTHTHNGTFALDLTAGPDPCNATSSTGLAVRAPFAGTVQSVDDGRGEVCLRTNDGIWMRLVHIDRSVGPGANVSQDAVIGTIAAPNTRLNAGIAHLHIEAYVDGDCAGLDDDIPFDSAHGTTLSGISLPDDGRRNVPGGQYYGRPLTRPLDGGQPPVADAGGPYAGIVGSPITFDASGSYDPDPGGGIILHEWDWTCDGTYDSSIVSPIITHTYTSPYSGCVRLRVTDTDFLTDRDTTHVEVIPPNRPPTAEPDGPYVTNEGTNVTLDGTGSSDPDGDPLTYAWDLDNDGNFDDATGPTPTFDAVGQDGVYTVRLRACDPEPLCDVDDTSVTVSYVAPGVSLNSDAPKDEGSAVTVSGVVTDPGWLDPLSAIIYWGEGTPPEPVGGVLENVRPDATLTFSISHVYGDNGVFTAEVCASDDDTTTCETIDLQIDNVDPTADIDMSGAILVNGVPTFIAHIGESLDFSGRSTDPGSDDLYLSWDWDDGSPVVTTTYLVNPPFPDPYPSPSIQPRDVTDTQTYAYPNACLYEVRFWAEDDDGGMSPVDTANVVIVGNADELRTAGYWQHQFRSHLTGRGRPHFDQPTLQCYLAISGYMSQVFDEVRDASTFDLAHDVLFVQQNEGDMDELFDRQLLAVWLNFANGSIEYDEPLGIDPLGITLTDFLHVVASVEEVRLDPAATRAQLEGLKNVLEGINLMDG